MSAARKTDSSGSSVSSDDGDASTPGDGIHRCDTVPPPEGEADAYNAPTKVGPMARGQIERLMAQSEVAEPTPKEDGAPRSGQRTALREAAAVAASVVAVPVPAAIPRIYADDDDDDLQGPRQSGQTQLLEVKVAKRAEASVSSAPPPALSSEALGVAPPASASRVDANRRSLAPRESDSGTKLLLVVGVVVMLGVAALYFLFATA